MTENTSNQNGSLTSSIFQVILIVIILFGASRLFQKDTWRAFYYPDGSNLLIHEMSPELSSYEACIEWIGDKVASNVSNPNRPQFDYECGKNCEIRSGSSLYVCDETIR